MIKRRQGETLLAAVLFSDSYVKDFNAFLN